MSWKDTAKETTPEMMSSTDLKKKIFHSSTLPHLFTCMHLTVNSWCVCVCMCGYPTKERKSSDFLFPSLHLCLFWGSYLFFSLLLFIFYFLVMFSPNRAKTLIFAEIVRRPHLHRKTWPTRMSWSGRNESRPKANNKRRKASICWHLSGVQ